VSKSRLESFSDAIIAIVMTVLVLSLREPAGDTFDGIIVMRDKILIYVVSFMTIAVYWINHHNLLALAREVNPRILWINLGFMFTLTFFPLATAWYGTHLTSFAPALTYAVVIFASDLIACWLAIEILNHHKKDKSLVAVFNKGKKRLIVSLLANILAIVMSFFIPNSVLIITICVLLMWLTPNPKTVSYFKKK